MNNQGEEVGSVLSLLPPDRPVAPPAIGRVRAAVRRIVPVRTRYAVRSWLLAHRGIAALYTALDPRLIDSRVTSDTDLVIEGFPRSANSYVFAAFHAANPGRTTASHAHSFALVRRAARLGVPTVLVVRDPRDVLASCMLYDPAVPPRQILREYVRMYAAAEGRRHEYLLAVFPEIVDDVGRVFERCNERFGTHFARYEKTPANERAVARQLDAWAQGAADVLPLHRMHRPSLRTRTTDEILADLSAPDRRRLAEATELYRRLVAPR